MELKWYWFAEILGLVKDISSEYNDGFTHWQVSANAGEVFFTIFLSLIPAMFFVGYLIHFIYRVKQKPQTGEKVNLICVIVLLIYAVLLAAGIGPYIQFYPQGAGFLDFSTLEHIIDGIYTAMLALAVFLGGKADGWMSKRKLSD